MIEGANEVIKFRNSKKDRQYKALPKGRRQKEKSK
jgi:hypothetical protein